MSDRLSGTGLRCFLAARLWRANDQICRHVCRALSEIKRDCRGTDMIPLRRIALIGNSLPRRCGIATFTTDLQKAISTSRPNLEACIVAMTDRGQTYDYPSSVALQIGDGAVDDYIRAAEFLNAGRFDVVCLQHE